jgi:hypothetical protein
LVPQIASCANCSFNQLDITGANVKSIQVRCYTCTKSVAVEGLILGEVDFLAGVKTKVDAMIDCVGTGQGDSE